LFGIRKGKISKHQNKWAGGTEMNKHLQEVINGIAEKYGSVIRHDARNYVEIDIGSRLAIMDCPELKEKYKGVNAIVPLKEPVKGMKVRIDGRTFVNYVQFESGIAVPGYVAKDFDFPYKDFVPNDSMIQNFTL
jgi:hypothetical protein